MSSRTDSQAPQRALSCWGVIAPPLTAKGKQFVVSSRRPVSTRSTARAKTGKTEVVSYWGMVAPPLTAAGQEIVTSDKQNGAGSCCVNPQPSSIMGCALS